MNVFQMTMDHYTKREVEQQSVSVYIARLPLGGECRVAVSMNDGISNTRGRRQLPIWDTFNSENWMPSRKDLERF
jgi:hypothetical protein